MRDSRPNHEAFSGNGELWKGREDTASRLPKPRNMIRSSSRAGATSLEQGCEADPCRMENIALVRVQGVSRRLLNGSCIDDKTGHSKDRGVGHVRAVYLSKSLL